MLEMKQIDYHIFDEMISSFEFLSVRRQSSMIILIEKVSVADFLCARKIMIDWIRLQSK